MLPRRTDRRHPRLRIAAARWARCLAAHSLHLFADIKGRLKGYLYLFDIDAYKRQALRLAHQAEHDSGTGVFNKGTTRQKIEMALNLYAMPKTCAFFMIDLDHFKQINDSTATQLATR